jgi:acyl carrier protein
VTDPENSLLTAILGICTEVLRQPVTAEENFFELGGTSLEAADFVVKLETYLGREFDLVAFLEARDFRDFAENVTESGQH